MSNHQIPSNIRDVPSLARNPLVDMFMVYQLLKRINTPYEKWPAYKLGIIDKSGKVLKKKSRLTTSDEKAAWGYFDIVANNMKKLIAKVPGGSSTTGTVIASYLMLREAHNYDMNERQVAKLVEELGFVSGDSAALGVAPANNIGQGNVKTFDPLLPKVKKILRRKLPNVRT
jgi:hypothetical protein